MATGRQKAAWARTALLACIGANPHRDPKKRRRPFAVEDFNPFATDAAREQKPVKIKISVDCLKGFCGPRSEP